MNKQLNSNRKIIKYMFTRIYKNLTVIKLFKDAIV